MIEPTDSAPDTSHNEDSWHDASQGVDPERNSGDEETEEQELLSISTRQKKKPRNLDEYLVYGAVTQLVGLRPT